ncbi:MAG TPA: helicase-associated domain-containing protein, partial [Polyangia bacterium]|nr:helicase-associated domain-containing protein [Polyangia bacterium]
MTGRLYLQTQRLDASLLDALARLFVREPNKREAPHVQIERALRDASAIEAALTKLAPDVLCALSVAIDAGGLVPRALLLGELQRALGDRAAPALTALATTGLMTTGSNGERLGVLEWIADALTWFVPAIEPLRDLAPGEPEPLRFDTAVLLALLADTRPRVNRDGGINATDLRRLDKRLAATPRLIARIDAFVDGLIDAHTLRLGDRVELDTVGVLRHFALPLGDSWGQLVRRQLSSWQMYRAYTLCAAAGARWLPAASLERVVRLRTHFYGGNRGATPDLTPFTQSLLLEQTIDGDGGRWFRAPQLPAPEGGKLVVQPSFEVLAPPNTPPAVIAQLGRFAKLQHADRFVTFRLDEDSVLTATDEGFTAEVLIALLTAHAEHALPQNVAVTIRSWTRAPKRAVLCAGLAVQLDSAEQQTSALAALRREDIAVTELGDRVLVVPEYERSRVKALLRKLAVRVVDRDPLHGNRDREDEYSTRRSAFVDERAERYHAPEDAWRLQARLRARMTEEPAPAARAAASTPARTKDMSSPARTKDASPRAKATASPHTVAAATEPQASRAT